jgi:hypothetical protein
VSEYTSEIPDGYKRCSKCGEIKSHADFYVDRSRKDDLTCSCQACLRVTNRQYREKHRGQASEQKRRWREANPDKVHHYEQEHRAERMEYRRLWNEANPDKVRKYKQKYRENNRDKLREKGHLYRLKNHDKEQLRHSRYANEYRDKTRKWKRHYQSKRRTMEVELPYSFTPDDENRALKYWHGHCAVCGNPLRNLFSKRNPSMDHWIPISDPRPDNPGTIAENMVPLCEMCNVSKSNHDPLNWLIKKYGKRKARQIASRIEAFFEWVRNQTEV